MDCPRCGAAMYRNRRYSTAEMQRYDCKSCGNRLPIETFAVGSLVQLVQFGNHVPGFNQERSLGKVIDIVKKPIKRPNGCAQQRYAVIEWPNGRCSEHSLVRLRQIHPPHD